MDFFTKLLVCHRILRSSFRIGYKYGYTDCGKMLVLHLWNCTFQNPSNMRREFFEQIQAPTIKQSQSLPRKLLKTGLGLVTIFFVCCVFNHKTRRCWELQFGIFLLGESSGFFSAESVMVEWGAFLKLGQ